MPAWQPDKLLHGYEHVTLELGRSLRGPLVTTVVRRVGEMPRTRAVLYLHGFIDYFFQTHLAEAVEAAGVRFYALDLRRHGRSWRLYQPSNHTRDMREYYEDLDAALEVLAGDGVESVALMGHSTGGLLAPLYAKEGRRGGDVRALVLNSPFFDFRARGRERIALNAIATLARLAPEVPVPGVFSPLYAASLHWKQRGEWDFDLAVKPLRGLPIFSGWIRAVLEAQARLQAGLDLDLPVLLLRSARSIRPDGWTDELKEADAVLDVDDMVKWASAVGPRVRVETFEGGMHDLVLSRRAVREEVLATIAGWLPEQLAEAK